MPKVYEIENFSLKIILLNQKFWFNCFLKTPKKPAQWAGWWLRKKLLIEKTHDSTVNPSVFNYCHQSKMISNPSITL